MQGGSLRHGLASEAQGRLDWDCMDNDGTLETQAKDVKDRKEHCKFDRNALISPNTWGPPEQCARRALSLSQPSHPEPVSKRLPACRGPIMP